MMDSRATVPVFQRRIGPKVTLATISGISGTARDTARLGSSPRLPLRADDYWCPWREYSPSVRTQDLRTTLLTFCSGATLPIENPPRR